MNTTDIPHRAVRLGTILAATADYLVEYEAGILTIARYCDGHAISLEGRGIAGQFRDCLRTHTPEQVTGTFLRMALGAHRRESARRTRLGLPLGIPGSFRKRDADGWEALYRPDRMPQPQRDQSVSRAVAANGAHLQMAEA